MNTETSRLTISIDPKLKKKLANRLMKENKTASGVIKQLLNMWLKKEIDIES